MRCDIIRFSLTQAVETFGIFGRLRATRYGVNFKQHSFGDLCRLLNPALHILEGTKREATPVTQQD